MLLVELLKHTFMYDIRKGDNVKGWVGAFKTDEGHDVEVKLFPNNYKDGPELMEVEFGRWRDKSAPKNWEQDPFGITNSGDAYKILATVVAIIRDVIVKEKPNYIMFSAEEPSRTKLYSSLVKRLTAGSQYKSTEQGEAWESLKSSYSNNMNLFLLKRSDLKESTAEVQNDRYRQQQRQHYDRLINDFYLWIKRGHDHDFHDIWTAVQDRLINKREKLVLTEYAPKLKQLVNDLWIGWEKFLNEVAANGLRVRNIFYALKSIKEMHELTGWSELKVEKAFFEKHKDFFIKGLLMMTKAEAKWRLGVILELIKKLRDYGVTWPELSVIEKSVKKTKEES